MDNLSSQSDNVMTLNIMIKKFRSAFSLLLIVSLTACGLADPSDELEENPDTAKPELISSEPSNKDELSIYSNQISLTLNEELDAATLATLNSLEIKSETNVKISGTWSLDATGKILTFALDDRASIPAGQQFKIDINGEITDKAGNPLEINYQFNTPSLYDITITTSELAPNDSLIVSQSTSTTPKSVTVDTNNQSFSLNANLETGDVFYLTIDQQPDNSFCSLSTTNGTISNSRIDVVASCHNVMPVHISAGNWNEFFQLNETTKIHGGELKTVSFNNIQSCDGIEAKDLLNVFEWKCDEVDSHIQITSAGMKNGKGLTDLVTFGESPNWKLNQVLVSLSGQPQDETNKGIWWTNPVVAATTSQLSSPLGIYVVHAESNNSLSFQTNADGVALIIEPGVTLIPASVEAGIEISNPFTWIEGDIDASLSHIGIRSRSMSFVTLNNVTVSKSEGNGIELSKNFSTRIINSHAFKNKESGIYISGNSVLDGQIVDSKNILLNTKTTRNAESGITIASSHASLVNLTSAHNDGDGIVITGSNNKLQEVSIYNNRQSGLVLSGANDNIINTTTITSNGSHGIKLQNASEDNNPQNNILSHLTTANNLASGIFFDTEKNENLLVNILNAYNATNSCPDTACDDVTTITTNDIAPNNLFAPISTETNIPDFSNANSNFLIASTFTQLDNKHRAWASKTTATESSGGGSCNFAEEDISNGNNLCILKDWSLNQADSSTARDQLNEVDETHSHTFINESEVVFLKNSLEIVDDDIGNDNGLCETNEACLLTTNIGSYQGHDMDNISNLDSANSLNSTLYQYDTNGR